MYNATKENPNGAKYQMDAIGVYSSVYLGVDQLDIHTGTFKKGTKQDALKLASWLVGANGASLLMPKLKLVP